MNVSQIAAIALAILFLFHATLRCHMHSDRVTEANGLRRFVDGAGERTESYQFTVNAARHAPLSAVEDWQTERAAWISSKTRPSNAPTDSALNTGILLASGVAGLCSCFYLADSMSSGSTGGWLSRPTIGYVVTPLVVGLAQHAAAWLHAYTDGKGQSAGESMCDAAASSTCVVGFVLPLCVVVEWAMGSTGSAMLFDAFQAWFLIASVLPPTLMMHSRGDDW